MPKSAVVISVPSHERLLALGATGKLDLQFREANATSNNDNPRTFSFLVPGILEADEIVAARNAGFDVNIAPVLIDGRQEHDIDLIGAVRRRDIPDVNGDRFRGAAIRDFDRIARAGYMSTIEIETALTLLSTAYPGLVTPIRLPESTQEGRVSYAVRIGSLKRRNRAVLFAGGFHGREWGSADACVHFAALLAAAYAGNANLTFGNRVFPAEQVRAFVEDVEIYVFPDVNPDGRKWSQKGEVWWRKNRNHAGGVDINRNFDFFWDSGVGSSLVPDHPNYRGAAAFSEAESRNVKYLFDKCPQIRYFGALHCPGDVILRNWNFNHSQYVVPSVDFRRPDAHAGDLLGTGAFLSFSDYFTLKDGALLMADAIARVRGGRLPRVPDHSFAGNASNFYRVAGTAEDYAFSRGAFGFTLTLGNEFIPPWKEMLNHIAEANAAMADLCLSAAADAYVKDSNADTGDVPSQAPYRDSPSVWVRNNRDGQVGHQDPIPGQDNWIYVTVHNRGRVQARNVGINVTRANIIPGDFEYARDWAGDHILAQRASPASPQHIGACSIAAIPPNGSATECVQWAANRVPNAGPASLLVEISPNDGPRPTGVHVYDSNSLAEKDVARFAMA